MARSGELDPLTRFRYTVYISIDFNMQAFTKAGFSRVTSPRVDISTSQYREGGRHLNPHLITEGATFSSITLQRGKSYSNDFLNWIGGVYKSIYGDEAGNTANYRGTVVIDHHNRRGRVVKKYILYNARPITYIPSSNFDSSDDTELSIESLGIEYEGFDELSLPFNKLQAIIGTSTSALIDKIGSAVGLGSTGTVTSLPAGFDVFGI